MAQPVNYLYVYYSSYLFGLEGAVPLSRLQAFMADAGWQFSDADAAAELLVSGWIDTDLGWVPLVNAVLDSRQLAKGVRQSVELGYPRVRPRLTLDFADDLLEVERE